MTNTPWVIRPAIGPGWAITYRGEHEVKRIAVETREDLESLRDLLTEYLAPEAPASPVATHLAVLFISANPASQGYTNVGVTIPSGTPTLKDIRDIERNAREKNGWPVVVLTALIPLGGAQ